MALDPTGVPDAARPDPVSVVLAPGRAEVRLAGDIDVTVAVRLGTRLRELVVDGHTEIVVDLSDVTFMDSSALGVLVSGQRQTRVFQGSFALSRPSPRVRRLLALTAMDRVFEIVEP